MSKRHEQLLFRYNSALERGDFDAVADVLREAERDPALEQMILDMNDAYAAERFNHTNPKEIPMLAALYQNPNRTRGSRVRWQGLPFVAALAVIALLTVMLAVRTRGSSPLNSGGDDSLTAVAQTSPYCSGVLVSSFTTVPLYSRPASDAPVVTELQHDHNAGREIVVLDRVSVDGEAWVFVRVPSSPDVPFGWITEAQFRTMVADCQPMIDGIAQRPLLVVTHDMNATVVPPVITSTPLPAIAQQPLFVVTQPSADAFVTVVPANVIPLSTFTPVPFVIEASPTPVLLAADDAAACEMVSDPNVAWLILYSRPTTTSLVVASLVGRYDANALVALDSTEADGQKWLYISAGDGVPQGWVTEADFNHAVNCFRANPAWQPTPVPPATELAATSLYMTATAMIQMSTAFPSTVVPQAAGGGVSVAATDLARFGEGGLCKATTLATADVLSLPSWEGEVVTTLSRNTVVSVGDYATSTEAQGNLLMWYVVGMGDVRGWMLASLLDTSACPFSAAPSVIFATPTPAPFTIVEATPVPFSAEPTLVPPLLVPVTSTPIPTPTLVR